MKGKQSMTAKRFERMMRQWIKSRDPRKIERFLVNNLAKNSPFCEDLRTYFTPSADLLDDGELAVPPDDQDMDSPRLIPEAANA